MKNAFQGVKNLVGSTPFQQLREKKFLIIGIGGVGSWIAEHLARSGAIHITLVDLDEICVSNINRQIHSHTSTIGKSKVKVMAERLLLINPEIKITIIEDFLTSSNIEKIITPEVSFVFDAIDSVKNKCLIIQRCKRLKVPFVITGGAGQRLDPSKIIICDLNKSINDRLLFQVRKMLRREFGYSKNTKRYYSIPTVSSTEVPIPVSPEFCDLKSNKVSNCESGLGSAGFVTASFAAVSVSYAIRKVCEL